MNISSAYFFLLHFRLKLILCLSQKSHFQFILSAWAFLILFYFLPTGVRFFTPSWDMITMEELLDTVFLEALYFLPLPWISSKANFNLPAAALEVTSVQIYTLYHGWRVVCMCVYLKPTSNCILPIICDFFLHSITGRQALCLFIQPDLYILYFWSLILLAIMPWKKLKLIWQGNRD